MDNMTVTQYMS